MGRSIIILLWLSFFLGACTPKDSEHATENSKMIQVTDYGSDFSLPESIWDHLLAKEQVAEKHEKAEGAKDNESTLNTFFSEIEVSLKEKTKGVLKEPSFLIKFPKGGGTLDISQYQTGAQGSYFIKFIYPSFEESKQKKVIFFSRSRKRRVGDLVLGSGCNTYFDVSKKFLKLMQSEGLLVNTTRHRDLSLLAGHFLFASGLDGQNYVSQIKFVDSMNTYLECGDENESTSKN